MRSGAQGPWASGEPALVGNVSQPVWISQFSTDLILANKHEGKVGGWVSGKRKCSFFLGDHGSDSPFSAMGHQWGLFSEHGKRLIQLGNMN